MHTSNVEHMSALATSSLCLETENTRKYVSQTLRKRILFLNQGFIPVTLFGYRTMGLEDCADGKTIQNKNNKQQL
jgi:hypothetical protein